MIKLIGNIEGEVVIFDYYPPNTFKAQIPSRTDSKYMVWLKAMDAAGNESVLSGMYILIDFKYMTFEILSRKYTSEKRDGELKYLQKDNVYKTIKMEPSFLFIEKRSPYSFRELMFK